MKILHFGDIHFWKIGTDRDFLYPKRALGVVNLSLRRRHKFPPAYAPAVAKEVARLAAEDIDLAIFSGDFTTMSLRSEYAMAQEAFEPIVDAWGDRLFAIPGNHDRYTPRAVADRRFEEHLPFAAMHEGRRVRTQIINSELAIVGLDCSHPCKVRSNGTLDEVLEREIDEALTAQQQAGRRTMLVGHYPYAYPDGGEGTWEHRLLNADRLERLVAKHQPAAYFHGHKHARWALYPESTSETACLNCGASGMKSSDPMKQAGFTVARFDDETLVLEGLESYVLHEDSSDFDRKPLPLP